MIKSKEREETARLGGESFTSPVFETNERRNEQSWVWLQNGNLKRETESLIVASQKESIRTNLVKAKIDKSQKDTLCRLCKKADESINHVVSGCSKIGKLVHWKLTRNSNFEAGDKWYEHEPQSVLESKDYKILSDFSIQ